MAYEHDPNCDVQNHIIPDPDSGFEDPGCVSREGTRGTASAWIVRRPGRHVRIDQAPMEPMTAEFAWWHGGCLQDLAIRAGFVPPVPT